MAATGALPSIRNVKFIDAHQGMLFGRVSASLVIIYRSSRFFEPQQPQPRFAVDKRVSMNDNAKEFRVVAATKMKRGLALLIAFIILSRTDQTS